MFYAVICVLTLVSYATVYANNVSCVVADSCDTCLSHKGCAFYVCDDKGLYTNVTHCERTQDKAPNLTCIYGGKRVKLEKRDNCTETPPPVTTTVDPLISTTSTEKPDDEPSAAQTFWTVLVIVILSSLVLFVIVFVAYKKIRKLYFTQEGYQSLNDSTVFN